MDGIPQSRKSLVREGKFADIVSHEGDVSGLRATSVPLAPMAIPVSAAASAEASLMPSPTKTSVAEPKLKQLYYARHFRPSGWVRCQWDYCGGYLFVLAK